MMCWFTRTLNGPVDALGSSIRDIDSQRTVIQPLVGIAASTDCWSVVANGALSYDQADAVAVGVAGETAGAKAE